MGGMGRQKMMDVGGKKKGRWCRETSAGRSVFTLFSIFVS